MKNWLKSSSVGLALLGFAVSVQAGTAIHFKNETIDTRQGAIDRLDKMAGNREWVVQYKNHIIEADKQLLQKNGLKIYSYIPEDALIVVGDAAAIAQVKKTDGVQAVLALNPSLKLSSSFGSFTIATSAKKETVVVSLFEAQSAATVIAKIQAISSDILVQRSSGTSVVLTAARTYLKQIAAIQGVEHVQPLAEIRPLHFDLATADSEPTTPAPAGDYKDLNGYETGTKVMNMESAWNLGLHGENQIVGMADTGLDSGSASAIHKDFTGAVKSGYAVGLFGKDWADPMGHGTHVAGSVLGRGTASGGLLHGAAPSAMMVAQGMWSPMLNNLSVPNDLSKLFSQAYADGARVHTNSWGAAANFGVYEKMAATVDQVMFEKQDLLVLFAAGNSGVDKNSDGRIDPNSIGTPGTAKNALTVGASENLVSNGGIQKKIGELKSAKDNWPVAPITDSTVSDNARGIAMFSSRGPTQDGRMKPEIVAPGTNILSVRSQQPTAEPLWGAYNTDYVWSGGTSMATPLTAGAAAVARQFLIQKLKQATPTAALLKAYLLHTATELFPGQYGEVGAARGQELLTLRPNNDEGYGLVNMQTLVELPGQGVLTVVDEKSGVATGSGYTMKLNAPRAGRLMVTLVWTDAPGSANAAKALVNDLDLEVTLPDGKVLNTNDQINNNAFVQSAVTAGEIKVTVKGVNVPMGLQGKQPFALVVSVQ